MTTSDYKFLTPGDMPEAACMLVINSMGQVLAICRADTKKYGMPGGKKEEGETARDCAIRELYEETGLKVTKVVPCFAQKVPGDKPFFTTTYFAQGVVLPPEGMKSSTPEGTVVWVDAWQLCDPEKSPFASYNASLFRSIHAHFTAAGV